MKSFVQHFVVALLLTVACATSAFAQSRTFVSAMMGSDLNLCTPTSPCRGFGRAMAVVASGGEIIALDSGGYGAVVVTKSVTVVAAPGIYAAITAAATGTAIDIVAPANSIIVLRGLAISGAPSPFGGNRTGISSLGVDAVSLHVENCTITGFDFGIRFHSPGKIAVVDSFVREAFGAGIWIAGLPAANFTSGLIDNVRAVGNGHGVFGPGSDFAAYAFSQVTVRNSTSLRSFRGFVCSANTPAGAAGSAKMTIVGSSSTMNFSSVMAGGHPTDQTVTGTIVLSDSTIAHAESKGIEIFPGGVVISKGNNTLNNVANDAFTNTVPLQ